MLMIMCAAVLQFHPKYRFIRDLIFANKIIFFNAIKHWEQESGSETKGTRWSFNSYKKITVTCCMYIHPSIHLLYLLYPHLGLLEPVPTVKGAKGGVHPG